MEGTSGTPHLLTDVRFTVSRKGYDPDEVDNFLERVSAAVAQLQDKLRQAASQAESAEARAAEAGKAQAVLQARIDALEGELAAARQGAAAAPPARNPEEDAQQASQVLLMAQRTADAAIEEANTSARATLSDARTQATTIVGDAEQEAARVLAKARAEADALVTERRQALAEEIRELESARDAVAGDVEVLQRHADEQRGVVQGALARLQSVLEDPAAFRVAPAPVLSGASLAAVPAVEEAPPLVDEPTEAEAASPTPITVEPVGEPVDEPARHQPEEHVAAEGPADEPAGADDGGVPTWGGPPSGPDTGAVPPVSAVFDDPVVSAPGSGSLFGDDGPPTAAHPPLQLDEEESPLGPPDAEADAAMRAFFEADFDDEPGRH